MYFVYGIGAAMRISSSCLPLPKAPSRAVSLFPRRKTAGNSQKTASASLLFRLSAGWKLSISAENERVLAVNFWKNSENSENQNEVPLTIVSGALPPERLRARFRSCISVRRKRCKRAS